MNGPLFPPPPQCDHRAATAVPWPTELDARSPTPPNQVNAVLAALDAVPPGHPQFIRTKAEPTQLLGALAVKGVGADTRELSDGTWRTLVRRPAVSSSF